MRDDAVALVEELNAELRSDKVTRRKAALKQLETHLASTDLAKLLDRTTLQLDAGLGGDVKLTWAGLCSSLMQCVSAEIHASAGKKAPANKLVAGILRRLVATAEDPKRRARVGVVAPLLRRAGKLFAHVLEILRRGPPDFATEYTHALRALLAEPRYCARVKASIYEELVDLYKERLAAALAAAARDDARRRPASDAAGRPRDLSRAAAAMSARHVPERRAARGGDVPGSALAGLADANRLEGHLPVTLAQASTRARRAAGDLAPATTLAHLARDPRPLVVKALLGKPRVSPRAGVRGDHAKKQTEAGPRTRDSAAVTRPAACCWRSAGRARAPTRCAASPRRWSARSPRSPRRRRRISTGATAMRRSRWSPRARRRARSRRTSLPRSARRRARKDAGRVRGSGTMSFPRRTPPLGMSGRSATGWTRAVVVGTATMTGSSRARDEEDSRAKTLSSSTRTTEKIQPSR